MNEHDEYRVGALEAAALTLRDYWKATLITWLPILAGRAVLSTGVFERGSGAIVFFLATIACSVLIVRRIKPAGDRAITWMLGLAVWVSIGLLWTIAEVLSAVLTYLLHL